MFPGYLFDLDGTLWWGDEEIPGAAAAVHRLQQRGAKIGYVTNNSTKSTADFERKLAGLGFPTEGTVIKSTASGAAAQLAQLEHQSAYVIGESGLTDAIGGVAELTDQDAEAVVVGLCFSFNYRMMETAMGLLRSGATFIATNRDATYPMAEGTMIPGAGSIVSAVEACGGRSPLVIGKPEPTMILQALAEYGLSADQVLVVGDRLDTDIEAGQRAGCPVHLVLSGVETSAPEDIPYSLDITGLVS
jgi:4-nitrophenyl phosphatase